MIRRSFSVVLALVAAIACFIGFGVLAGSSGYAWAATISGLATSYDLPQYVGELFQKTERPNALLRLIGGIAGRVRVVKATKFPMGVDYVLPAAAQPAIVEGADPSFVEQDTAQVSNLVQIFQTGVNLSYTKQSESASIDGVAIIPGSAGQDNLILPGTVAFQLDKALQRTARNMNYSFLRGAFQEPADNTTARKTRGIRTAVTTNLFANGGTPRALTKAIFENALRDAMNNGAFQMGSELFALADKAQIQALADLYRSDTRLPESRTVVGIAVTTIATHWAIVHLVWEPDMDTGEIMIFRPDKCRPVALEVVAGGVRKGLLFSEPLAKSGSADKHQVYGEWGVDYTNEVFHAVIDDLS